MVTRFEQWRGILTSSLCALLTAVVVPPLTLAQPDVTPPKADQLLQVVPTATDPLQSPFPLPWTWIEQGHEAALKAQKPLSYRQQTARYVSPDGRYVAEATLYFQAAPQAFEQQLTSILEITDLHTGDRQRIDSLQEVPREFLAEVPRHQGLIAVLVPVGWSQRDNRLLVRQFMGLFASDLVTDAAWIWQPGRGHVATVYPTAADYDVATLLGWSHTYPDQVLFQTHVMGDAQATLWAVDSHGSTQLAQGDRPAVYGTTLPATATARQP
ncbi:hypothetical protein [Parathermosynechococcus lividus]|nr:hypothetical protein [Synechococcus sp. PCC 6716]